MAHMPDSTDPGVDQFSMPSHSYPHKVSSFELCTGLNALPRCASTVATSVSGRHVRFQRTAVRGPRTVPTDPITSVSEARDVDR